MKSNATSFRKSPLISLPPPFLQHGHPLPNPTDLNIFLKLLNSAIVLWHQIIRSLRASIRHFSLCPLQRSVQCLSYCEQINNNDHKLKQKNSWTLELSSYSRCTTLNLKRRRMKPYLQVAALFSEYYLQISGCSLKIHPVLTDCYDILLLPQAC